MFFLLECGISGSGKSTHAYYMKNTFLEPVEIVSSDSIREELYGNESIQGDANKIFRIMLARTKQYLGEGKSVIYDATNLSDRRRINLLKDLEKFDCTKWCHVLIVDPRMCSENQKLRSRHVDDEIIYRQVKQFRPPHKSEGWDVITMDIYAPENEEELIDYFHKKLVGFDQHNPNHSLSLYDHMQAAMEYAYNYSRLVHFAAAWHDFGKLMTQTFDDNKIAHYYSHENVSAYYWLLFNASSFNLSDAFSFSANVEDNEDFYTSLDIAWLIAHHMDFFKDEKYLEKVRARAGEYLYNELVHLHECDMKAH